MLRIGPAGNSEDFYASGRKHTLQAPQYLEELGLNAFEYSFGRGVSIKEQTARAIGEEMAKYDIAISAHAPYYINLAGNEESVQNSFRYVRQSLQALKWFGGNRLVIHTGTYQKNNKRESVVLAGNRYLELIDYLKNEGFSDFYLCPESMGKYSQIGDVAETLFLASLDEHLLPCFDFGHINSRTQGGLKNEEDFGAIIEQSIKVIGEQKTKKMHVHFSKILYSAAGEVKHLNFDDTVYGPEFAPFASVIKQYALEPVLICESKQRMSGDAVLMKKDLINIGVLKG